MKKSRDLIENFILFVILLVLVQTFVEDLAVLLGWSWSVRKTLVISGFGFDLFFSIEFLARYFSALKKGRAKHYLMKERGWIDLIASLPLLLFSSGPGVVALLEGAAYIKAASILNILKVVKTVRIARILRLLRLLKIFKKIKFVNAVMAQRHVTRIITTVISSFVLTLTAVSFLLAFVDIDDAETDFVEKHEIMARTAESLLDQGMGAVISEFEGYESVLIIRTHEGTIYTRHDNSFYDRWFGPSDYGYLESGEVEFFYSLKPLYAAESRSNILIFISIIVMLIVLMLTYSPHFALTITDPINIMFRGMSDSSYNLEVIVLDEFKEDGVYKLARQYNEEYLPLKARSNDQGQGGSALKMDDFEDLFK